MFASFLVQSEGPNHEDNWTDDFETWGEIVDYLGEDIDLPDYPTFGDEPKFSFQDGDVEFTIYYVEIDDDDFDDLGRDLFSGSELEDLDDLIDALDKSEVIDEIEDDENLDWN